MKGFSDRTKVVLRHLPPAISQSTLKDQIDAAFAGRYHWVAFRPGKSRLGFCFFFRNYALGEIYMFCIFFFCQWIYFETLQFRNIRPIGNGNAHGCRHMRIMSVKYALNFLSCPLSYLWVFDSFWTIESNVRVIAWFSVN